MGQMFTLGNEIYFHESDKLVTAYRSSKLYYICSFLIFYSYFSDANTLE